LGGATGFRSADALHLGHPGIRIEFGYGEKLVAGLLDPVFHPQPVEERALGLLLVGNGFGQVPNEMTSSRRSARFHS